MTKLLRLAISSILNKLLSLLSTYQIDAAYNPDLKNQYLCVIWHI